MVLKASDGVPLGLRTPPTPRLSPARYPQPDEIRLYAELLLYRAQSVEAIVTTRMQERHGPCVGRACGGERGRV